jgi:hypothetical protein
MTATGEVWIAKAAAWPQRPGLLRRSAAFFIDYLLVFLFLVAAVAALFRLTNGAIQGDFTLKFGACYEVDVNWNAGPSPPPEYDKWKLCNTSLLGLVTASRLVGTSSSTEAEFTLPLGADGVIRDGVLDLGFLELIAFFVYVLAMDWRTGASIGKRVMAIAVYDESDRHRVGLPARKALRRSIVKFLGAVPLILVQTWYGIGAWFGTPDSAQEYSSVEYLVAFGSLALAPAWVSWIAMSIALDNDPIHDRYAETTVRVDSVET